MNLLRALYLVAAVVLAHGARAGAPSSSPTEVHPEEIDALEVHSRDGRVLRGTVDARTDDERLWIRREEGPMILAASVAWIDVESALLGDAPIEPDELRRRRSEIASAGPTKFFAAAPKPGANAASNDLPAANGSPIGEPPRRQVRVRNLDVVAVCLVNLDRDAEPDGLEVTIAAVAENGPPAAVRGALAARLIAQRQPGLSEFVEFPEIDRWSQPVSASDFIDGLATYRLPFRRAAPEWQFDLMPDALLEVQLGAFGHGNFTAAAPVAIRPFNPWRDNRQLWTGTRFAPRERYGRRPTSAPVERDGLWFDWRW